MTIYGQTMHMKANSLRVQTNEVFTIFTWHL